MDAMAKPALKAKLLAVRARFDSNFRLAVLMLFGGITVAGIMPFAVYRFATGNPLIGTLDLLIVVCICLINRYAWRTGNIDRATILVSITNSAGCVLVGGFAGLAGLLWMSPTVMANFLLVDRRSAVLVSTLAIVAMTLINPALVTPVQQSLFLVSASIVSVFAYVFASRAELQRHQLEAIAVNDPLTGAYNRRGLDAEMSLAIAASARSGASLGLAVLDLDHFKRINDDFGHDAGDTVLVQFAELVRRSTRSSDRFFRLGGEEFALLLPGADVAALNHIAEKLRQAVEQEIRIGDRAVTVSIGATPLLRGESSVAFLGRADAAMYRAKRAGRNRVIVEYLAAGASPAADPPARRQTPA